ncbi:Putative LOC100212901, partial [Caligus rogercresseyi]
NYLFIFKLDDNGKFCVAPGCKSGYKPKGNEGKKRRFHMFPKDEPLRQLWTKA